MVGMHMSNYYMLLYALSGWFMFMRFAPFILHLITYLIILF